MCIQRRCDTRELTLQAAQGYTSDTKVLDLTPSMHASWVTYNRGIQFGFKVFFKEAIWCCNGIPIVAMMFKVEGVELYLFREESLYMSDSDS